MAEHCATATNSVGSAYQRNRGRAAQTAGPTAQGTVVLVQSKPTEHFKRRPLGGWFVLRNGVRLGWVVRHGTASGRYVGSGETRREAADEVYIAHSGEPPCGSEDADDFCDGTCLGCDSLNCDSYLDSYYPTATSRGL